MHVKVALFGDPARDAPTANRARIGFVPLQIERIATDVAILHPGRIVLHERWLHSRRGRD